ncbi:hypothetical protein HPP92_020453 [Vanilla planifolia]|uniref:Probable 6-phosphogluconolactonase n=1 Tax=Vanilla planifolia TaxID=51239 RepID=A0A835Q797_VANPL|nr:hypothetical protein HPP92_020453 [Vanilla planifolia]
MAASYDTKSKSELRIFESLDDLSTDLAEYIAQLSEDSVKERGLFTIALTGGSLISLIWKLCEAPYNKTVDWTKWYVFWADERAVAKNHVDSNYKLTKEGFLSKVAILHSHIYSINDNVTVEEAAGEYKFAIRQLVKARTIDVSESNDCPKFDLIILEVGSDGHVASLFPRNAALEHEEWITHITDSPESPPERITFTLPVINSASNIAMIATGKDKAIPVQVALESLGDASLPASMVNPTEGKLVWFLDRYASAFIATSGKGDLEIL